MQLNLPILEHLADSKNILISGAGGGFDVFAGLPLYFTLRAMGKTVHLANYSFTEFHIAQVASQPQVLLEDRVLGARGNVDLGIQYFPEGYLAQWFNMVRGEAVTIWMLARTGVAPLVESYA